MKQEMLDQYLVALQFFSRVLQNPPDEELLRHILREELFKDFQDWECFRPPAGREPSPFSGPMPRESIAALVQEYSGAGGEKDVRACCLQLHMDHLNLFSGPAPKAPPWESVWRERDKLLFGKHTEEVFAFYADWGVGIENAGHDPEDHLGLELAFALFLLRAMSGGEPAKSGRGLAPREALVAFLERHILPWAGRCLEKASQEAETVFYRNVPQLCRVMLANLHAELTP